MAETKADIEAERDDLKAKLEELEAGGGSDDRTIVQRILDIAAEVGVLAPEKSGGVPFAFRGVDMVVAKLTPLLNKHRVFVTPVNTAQLLDQRETGGGKVVTKADVTATYRFYGEKGDFIDAQVVGQADDFADRSTAQAMSVAFRILLLQTFHIAANGNEEEFSEGVKNQREAAGQAKVAAARAANTGPSPAPAPASGPTPAEQMRNAIVAAAGQKGWQGDKINEFATQVTGKGTDGWWDDAEELNKILVAINK